MADLVVLRKRSLIAHVVRASIDSPRRVIVVWAFLVALSGIGITELRVDTETTAFLDRNGPLWRTYEESVREFGSDEFITIAIEGNEGYAPQALLAAKDLTQAIQSLATVERVESVSSVALPQVDGDGSLTFEPLVQGQDGIIFDADRLGEWTGRNRSLAPWLISADGNVLAVNAFIATPDPDLRRDSIRTVQVLAEKAGGIASGVPIFRSQVNDETLRELAVFLPLTAFVVLGLCLFVFRSFVFVIVQAVCGFCCVFVTLGLMGAIGTPVSLATLPLPAILVAVSAAYSVHVVAAGMGDEAGARRAIEELVLPLSISALTTSLGFLAMALVGIGAIRDLAVFGAAGVVVLLGAVLTIGPAIIVKWSSVSGRALRPAVGHRAASRLARIVVDFSVRNKGSVVTIWMVFFVAGAVGMLQLRFDSNIINWFPRGEGVRDSYETIQSSLAGITPVSFLVDRTDGERIDTGKDVRAINEFAENARAHPMVGAALSVSDLVRSLGDAWTGSSALPASDSAISQYLIVLEGNGWWSRLVSSGGETANVSVLLRTNGSGEILAFASQMREWLSESYGDYYRVRPTGIMFEFARSQDSISKGQVQGLLLAAGVVALIVWFAFRSLPLACAVFAPTLPPIIAVYGALGILGIPLDAATASIGAVAVGLAVDDSLHLGFAYAREMRDGRSMSVRVRRSFVRILPILTLTTGAVALGFGIFSLSDFKMMQTFGVVSATIVVLCLVADATLFPALLAAMSRGKHGLVRRGGMHSS